MVRQSSNFDGRQLNHLSYKHRLSYSLPGNDLGIKKPDWYTWLEDWVYVFARYQNSVFELGLSDQ